MAGEEVLAMASWDLHRGLNPLANGFICVDEDRLAAEWAVEYLVGRMCREISRPAPALIRLNQLPGGFVTRRLALGTDLDRPKGSKNEIPRCRNFALVDR